MQGTPEAVPEESGTPDSYSAETFPRSFRIQRSGSADSLASLVRCFICPVTTAYSSAQHPHVILSPPAAATLGNVEVRRIDMSRKVSALHDSKLIYWAQEDR